MQNMMEVGSVYFHRVTTNYEGFNRLLWLGLPVIFKSRFEFN